MSSKQFRPALNTMLQSEAAAVAFKKAREKFITDYVKEKLAGKAPTPAEVIRLCEEADAEWRSML